ncbi:hypothetical protein BDV95DRAFT_562694 [Massariosphaeria phaeospora]|uniref:Uncharacterized protein n=1 Tax=Massariosphaeria phaeospora TaxID=100035 RepID=A0A7C8IJF6_9PLEO|nr:hypothetical protein BDV95DRAFT_562694 [Massariosphaeria phaeospora]
MQWWSELESRRTYNSGYSLVVTHLTTNPPVHCLNSAERTGSVVFSVLWSYVGECSFPPYILYVVMLDPRLILLTSSSLRLAIAFSPPTSQILRFTLLDEFLQTR